MDMAVLSGTLSLPGYETDPDRYRASKWVPRSWEWVDPQKEVAAYKSAVRSGFKTLGQVISEQGGDIEELLTMRQAELAMLDEKNIITDTDPSETSGAGLTQARPANSADPFGDTDPPVSDEEEVQEDGDD